MPRIIVTGDVHGHLDKLVETISSEQIDFALQVGDFGIYLSTGNLSAIPSHRREDLGQFEVYFKTQKAFPIPTYFCKGNHEDFEFLANYKSQDQVLPNLFYMMNGSVVEIQGVKIAFLGGNFSPKWFERPHARKYQNQKVLGYLRKDEVEVIKNSPEKIDILVTHEPSFAPQFTGNKKYGCQVIQDLIMAIQPTYAFSGHIHKYAEGMIGRTKCIALGAIQYQATSSYLLSL